MAVGGKQRDQGNQRAGKKRDPALKVEEQNPNHLETTLFNS
jgi:hypothetical protein